MSEGLELERFPNGNRRVLDADGHEVYEQAEYGDGLAMGLPYVRLSDAGRLGVPEGAVTSYRIVATPRVGIDGLREALIEIHGLEFGPPRQSEG